MNVFLFSILSSILVVIPTLAEVNMNNGEYYESWVDLEVPGDGFDMTFRRTYKSKSSYEGLFGMGWCSRFETKLQVTAEGQIKINECGDGKEIYYLQDKFATSEYQKSIDAIIEKVKNDKNSDKKSASAIDDLKKQLAIDITARDLLAEQYGLKAPIKENIRYKSIGIGGEYVTFHKSYYLREKLGLGQERFDEQGRLIQINDNNNNFIKINYVSNRMSSMVDNNGRKLEVSYFDNGRVKSISGPNEISASYKYDKKNRLEWSKDAWASSDKEFYTYSYDNSGRLQKAVWYDKTFVTIKYESKYNTVQEIVGRDKCLEKMNFTLIAEGPQNHYKSESQRRCGNNEVGKYEFEFWQKFLPSGEPIIEKHVKTENGSRVEFIYHPTFGSATSIADGSGKTTFDYYPNGQLKTKVSLGTTTIYTYEPKWNRVETAKVETILEGKKNTVTSKFKYDRRGNLETAQTSNGKKINLTYDHRGRIQTITEGKKIMTIDYEDRFGKPSKLTSKGQGTVSMTYKPTGELDKVNSSEGPVVAAQLSYALSELYEILTPANGAVSL